MFPDAVVELHEDLALPDEALTDGLTGIHRHEAAVLVILRHPAGVFLDLVDRARLILEVGLAADRALEHQDLAVFRRRKFRARGFGWKVFRRWRRCSARGGRTAGLAGSGVAQ